MDVPTLLAFIALAALAACGGATHAPATDPGAAARAAATDPQDRAYDYHQKGVQFRVIGTSREIGVARLGHRWEFR